MAPIGKELYRRSKKSASDFEEACLAFRVMSKLKKAGSIEYLVLEQFGAIGLAMSAAFHDLEDDVLMDKLSTIRRGDPVWISMMEHGVAQEEGKKKRKGKDDEKSDGTKVAKTSGRATPGISASRGKAKMVDDPIVGASDISEASSSSGFELSESGRKSLVDFIEYMPIWKDVVPKRT